jgi:UDP-N-acetylmuramate--alanine ligase
MVAHPPDLLPYRRIHLVGAGGSGMSGLAKLMAGMGYAVTGSDLKPGRTLDGLSDVGVETWIGHRPERVTDWDLVVASSAVPDRDPELSAAEASGVPVWRRPALLRAVTAAIPTLGIAGTHGKTSSTALAVTALRSCGFDPTFLVGGEMIALGTGAHLGVDDLFVLEADEAFGTFRHLILNGLMVANIEADHLDYYRNVAALEEAFAQVATGTKGPIVGCLDDPGVRRLSQRAPVVGYGTSPDATWRMADIEHEAWAARFTLTGPAGRHEVSVPRPGAHIARNAAGVLALIGEFGYDLDCAVAGLAESAGVRRRYELRAEVGGIAIIDDYAHHPTEVSASVTAARRNGATSVWVVFQPHRYTRTADLAPEFGAPLAQADRVIVTDVYAAGEAPIPGVSGKLVAEAVAAAGGDVQYEAQLRNVPAMLAEQLAPGDVVLLLGAGDVTSIADDLAAEIGGSG